MSWYEVTLYHIAKEEVFLVEVADDESDFEAAENFLDVDKDKPWPLVETNQFVPPRAMADANELYISSEFWSPEEVLEKWNLNEEQKKLLHLDEDSIIEIERRRSGAAEKGALF